MSEIDAEVQLFVNKKSNDERVISDSKYADKLVEKIVFGAMGLVATGVLAALISLVIK